MMLAVKECPFSFGKNLFTSGALIALYPLSTLTLLVEITSLNFSIAGTLAIWYAPLYPVLSHLSCLSCQEDLSR
jgi:hypothetical protein